MNRKKHLIFISLALIAAMFGAMLSPIAVRADDNAPPPTPESEPAAPPEETPTEETPAEPAPEISPAEILASLPEEVSLVVLDESGETLPLAAQEALQILAAPDPYFTVGGNLYTFTAADCDPVTAGAQPCPNPIQAAVNWLSSNDWSPDDNTIYVESGTFTENVTINGSAWTSTPSALIVQGAGSGFTTLDGWMNVSNLNHFALRGFTIRDADSSGNDVYLVFDNLQGELLLNDVEVDRNPLVVSSQPGILITDQGDDVFVYNVISTGSYDAGMVVETIVPGSLVDIYDSIFSHNGRFGLDITSAGGTVMLEDVYAADNGWDGVHIYGSAPTNVFVSDSSFRFNGETGLVVHSNGGDIEVGFSAAQFNMENGFFLDTYNVSASGDITLAFVAATNNGYSGLVAYGNEVTFAFVYMGQNVEAGALVVAENAFMVSNGYFEDNGLEGLYAEAGSYIEITDSEFRDNGEQGAELYSYGGGIYVNGSDFSYNLLEGLYAEADWNFEAFDSTFHYNGGSGLWVSFASNAYLDEVGASGNGGNGAFIEVAESASIVESSFTFNDIGLAVRSLAGAIALDDVLSVNNQFGASLEGFLGVSVYDSNFSENFEDGLFAYSDHSGITVAGTTANANAQSGAWLYAGNGNVFVTDSGFSYNGDTGVYALAFGGDVTLFNSQFLNNGDDGAFVSASGDAYVECSYFQDNGGYGAIVDTANTFVLDSFFSGNASGDYLFTGGGTLTQPGVCFPVAPPPSPPPSGSGGKKGSGAPGLPIRVVNVSGGNAGVKLDCRAYRATLLVLPNGDSVLFPCPLRDEGLLSRPANPPAAPPGGARMLSVLEAGLRRDGTLLQIVDGALAVRFVVPEGVNPANLAILWWDGSQWVELSAAGGTDGRAVFNSGALNAEGMFEASLNFTGIFMLVER